MKEDKKAGSSERKVCRSERFVCVFGYFGLFSEWNDYTAVECLI